MARIEIKHGSEGPKHDPYSYTEITFTPTHEGGTVYVLHMGLVDWIKGNGKLIPCADVAFEFKTRTGLTPEDAQQILIRMKHRCKCGCRQTRSKSGYPGESFNVCIRCGNTVSTDFHESEII